MYRVRAAVVLVAWVAACSGPAPARRAALPPRPPEPDAGVVAAPDLPPPDLDAPDLAPPAPPLQLSARPVISTGEASPEELRVHGEHSTGYTPPVPARNINRANRWGRPGKGSIPGDGETGAQPDPRDWKYTGQSPYETRFIKRGRGKGLALPYPLTFVIKKLGKCRRGKRGHIAIDLGGIGPNHGLGTPIRSLARAKVIRIGLPRRDEGEFGQPDLDSGYAYRRGRALPRSMLVPGYGRVRFFTHDYGRWRSGVVISTRILEGRYKGYKARYMHLGAVHPGLRVGSVVDAGQEIGLMGCTAILNDLPHLHFDIWTPGDRRRVDPSPILGLSSGRVGCRRKRQRKRRKRRRRAKKAGSSRAKTVSSKGTKEKKR